jgi:hypothetical protein
MVQKVYRTAQGKTVDFGAMAAKNEKVRAVGNMAVNARGDRIDNQGNVIATRSQQINKNLNRQTNTSASAIPTSNRAQAAAEAEQQKLAEQEKLEQARLARQAARQAIAKGETPTTNSEIPAGGLAAAMARAAQIKDEE